MKLVIPFSRFKLSDVQMRFRLLSASQLLCHATFLPCSTSATWNRTHVSVGALGQCGNGHICVRDAARTVPLMTDPSLVTLRGPAVQETPFTWQTPAVCSICGTEPRA